MNPNERDDNPVITSKSSIDKSILTILFVPEAAYGPTNQCIGIGTVLRSRGHRVVFATESSWKGKLADFGFEEYMVDYSEQPATNETIDVGQFWSNYIRMSKSEFRKSTIDQMESFMLPTWKTITDGARYAEKRLREIVKLVNPNVIVEDNVVCFPALLTSDVPFIRIVSCNPLEIRGLNVAPVFSGLPTNDRSQWAAFQIEYDRVHRSLWNSFNEWVIEQGTPPLDDLQFIHTSWKANLYIFPKEADYVDVRPLDSTWHRIDSSVRETDDEYILPKSFQQRPNDCALIYLSLGSLGGANVELMQRLIDVLSHTQHRYIISKGPLHEQIKLASNMIGASMLPQTRIIPQVDLVITHGGNNTTTESLHFGKPMILLPLFWDQYDNAQRMDELGFGIRLSPYTFRDEELTDAINKIFTNKILREHMNVIGERIRSRNGLQHAANIIETIGQQQSVQ